MNSAGHCTKHLKVLIVLFLLTVANLACTPDFEAQENSPKEKKTYKDNVIITDDEKSEALTLYRNIKYTHRFIHLMTEAKVPMGVLFPEVDSRWVLKILQQCKMEAVNSPKYLERLLYNKNVSIQPKAQEADCPIFYQQEINPTVKKTRLKFFHRVPTKVQLIIDHSDLVPNQIINEISLTGLATKLTSFTSQKSGHSELNEKFYGYAKIRGTNYINLSYDSKIQYRWDKGKTTYLKAQLNWHFKINDKEIIVQELHRKNNKNQLISKLYLNGEYIDTKIFTFNPL